MTNKLAESRQRTHTKIKRNKWSELQWEKNVLSTIIVVVVVTNNKNNNDDGYSKTINVP